MGNQLSLSDFASRNQLNNIIAENLVDVRELQNGEKNFEDIAYICFQKAYSICDILIKESPAPIWKLPECYKLAHYNSFNNDLSMVVKIVVLTLVHIFTDHLEEEWKSENKKLLNKIKNDIYILCDSPQTALSVVGIELGKAIKLKALCDSTFKTLHRGTDIDYLIPFEEFSLDPSVTNFPSRVKSECQETNIQSSPDETVKDLQNTISNLNAQLDASNDRVQELETEVRTLLTYKKEIEEFEELSNLTPEERLAIDERAIFFSSAIGLDFDPKRTNQKQLACMISTLSGDAPDSIRGRISKMHKMEKEGVFSEEIMLAARNVKGLLEKVPKGNQPQKMKDILQNVDLVFLNTKNS